MPKVGCELDKLQWIDVLKPIRDTSTYSQILIQILTRSEQGTARINPSPSKGSYAEDDVEIYTNKWTREADELEIDFRDSKSCEPCCTELFPILTSKQLNDGLIDYYFRDQPQDIRCRIKQFDFGYTDLEDEELVSLIDTIIGFKDVYSQHKFDIGQTKQKFRVLLRNPIQNSRGK